MAIEPSSTFRYKTTVPAGGTESCPWTMESDEIFKPTGYPVLDNRLVGWYPQLQISEAGMTPNPGPTRPAVLRSELRLMATDKKCASQLTASFFLDKALVNKLRPGDVFHMAQSNCCGLGFSAIRQGKLIFAVGEISAVPRGSGIQVGTPMDLIEEAQEVFRRRDPNFEFPELPIEVRSGEKSSILFDGWVEGDGYHVRVLHGADKCDDTRPECVAISLDEACDWIAASASAQLLEIRE
jgi:hypothetical protein